MLFVGAGHTWAAGALTPVKTQDRVFESHVLEVIRKGLREHVYAIWFWVHPSTRIRSNSSPVLIAHTTPANTKDGFPPARVERDDPHVVRALTILPTGSEPSPHCNE